MPSNSNAALSTATAPVAVGSSRKAPREPKSRRAPRSKPTAASSDRSKGAAEPEFRILTQNGPSKPIAKPDGLLPNPSAATAAGKRAKQSRRSSMPTSVAQPSSTAAPVVPIIHSAPVLAPPPSSPPRSPDLRAQSPPNTEVFLMSPQHFRTSPPRSNSSSPGSRDSESSALLAYFTQCSSPTSSAAQLAKHERWAGGAFQNSPDPSALPLPDFETIPTTATSSSSSSSSMLSTAPQPTTAPIPMPSRASSTAAPLLPASPIAMHHYPAPPPPSPAHAAPQPYYPAPFFAMPANPYMHSQSAPPVPSYYGFMATAQAPAPAPNTADLSNDLRKMLNIHAF